MSIIIQTLSQFGPSVLNAGLKTLAVAVIGLTFFLLARRSTAATRHLILAITVAALLIVPVLTPLLPDWTIHVPGSWIASTQPAQDEMHHEASVSGPVPIADPDGLREIASNRAARNDPAAPRHTETIPDDHLSGRLEMPVEVTATADRQPVVAKRANAGSARRDFSKNPKETPPLSQTATSHHPFAGWIVLGWLIGVAGAISIPVLGFRKLKQICRRAEPGDDSWEDSLRQVMAIHGIRRSVQILVSKDIDSPVTWGMHNPVIIVPQDTDWPDDRRRVVLYHELAHIRRFDWATQMLAHVACAVYWFNPIVWWMAKRMRIEQERATDDLVLAAGTQDTDYASELVHFAKRLKPIGELTIALPMARRSTFEQRVRDILDRSRKRGSVSGRLLAAGLLVCAAILIPIAMFTAKAEFQRPHPASVSRGQSGHSALTAFYTHDGKNVEYAVLNVSLDHNDRKFSTTTSCDSNSVSRTWSDKVTMTVDGTEIPFSRDSKQPDLVKIFDRQFSLDWGRVFVVKTIGYERPQVEQLKLDLTRSDFEDLESVFAKAHQPGTLQIATVGAGYGVPGKREVRHMEVYSLHDEYRTRLALFHDSNNVEYKHNGSNDPKAKTWIIDTTLKLENGNEYRLQCESDSADTLLINDEQFDLTKGRTFEALENGTVVQHEQFPGVIRDSLDMAGLYAHFRGLQPKPTRMTVDVAIKKEQKLLNMAPPDRTLGYMENVPDHAVQVKLPHGGAVRFHALYSKENQQWWSPRGKTLEPKADWAWRRKNWQEQSLFAIFEWIHPGAKPPEAAIGPLGGEWVVPINSVGVPVTLDDGRSVFRVGFGAGPWKNRGALKPGENLQHGFLDVSFSETGARSPVDPQIKPGHAGFGHTGLVDINCSVTLTPELDFALIAVDKDGMRRVAGPTYNGRSKPVTPGKEWRLRLGVFGMDINTFSSLEVMTRRRCWAEFSEFATQPQEEPADVKAAVFDASAAAIAEFESPKDAIREFLRSLRDRNHVNFFATVADDSDSQHAHAFFAYEAALSHLKSDVKRTFQESGWDQLCNLPHTNLDPYCLYKYGQFKIDIETDSAVAQAEGRPELYLTKSDSGWKIDLKRTLVARGETQGMTFDQLVSYMERAARVVRDFRSRASQFDRIEDMDREMAQSLVQVALASGARPQVTILP